MNTKSILVWSSAFGVLAGACSKAAPRAALPPSSAVVVAADRVVVTLTPEARQHLGIAVASVTQKDVHRVRKLAGDVRVPPGRSITLTAPLAARVRGVSAPVGAELQGEAPILSLSPLLSADSRASFAAMRIDAEGAAASAKVQFDGAEVELARAERMLRDGVGSERAVEQARVVRDTAKASAAATALRRDQLGQAIDGSLATLPVVAPFACVLRQLMVADGQHVAAGAPLAEVADLRRLWLRVPVPVDEVKALDADAKVAVDGLVGKRAAAPPSGDSVGNTVDLWYEVDDVAGALRPGQSVFVAVPLAGQVTHLVVPWSAILRDERGRAFVYAVDGKDGFVRRAVDVRFVHDGEAAITGAITAGDPVVVIGVPELWGIESGHAR